MNEAIPEASTPIRTQAAPGEPPSVLVKFWEALGHPLLLGVLAFLAAGVMAVHLWLPQLPTALANDPLAAAAWLDSVSKTIPGGNVFRALGLFDVVHNLILRVLLPLFATVLFIHMLGTALTAWRVRNLAPPLEWLPGLIVWEAVITPAPDERGWFDACTSLCGSPRHRTLVEKAEEICDCHHRAIWVGLALELGLLLALAALLLNLYSGWQMDSLTLDPGQKLSLAPYANMNVSLSEDATQIVLCCPQTAALVSYGRVRQNGVVVKVTRIGQAAKVALSHHGQSLQLQAIEENAPVARELVVHFPEPRSERIIAAPEANLALRLVALERNGVRVQVLDADNQTIFSEDVYERTALSVGDDLVLRITPTSYVTFRAQGRPWIWLLIPAGFLILIGLITRWRWPYWRLGLRTNAAGAAIRWQGARSTRSYFRHFLAYLQTQTDQVKNTQPDQ